MFSVSLVRSNSVLIAVNVWVFILDSILVDDCFSSIGNNDTFANSYMLSVFLVQGNYVLIAVNVWVFICDSMCSHISISISIRQCLSVHSWFWCGRTAQDSLTRELSKGISNVEFTQLSQNLISQWWRTSWRNLIFEGNNLLICFQFETFNFVKICQKLFWFWAARIISLLGETASSSWGVPPNPKS